MKPHVLVATPVGGGVVAHEYLHGIQALAARFGQLGWAMDYVSRPDGLVTRSRNAFASQVVRSDSVTHLLMLDADVVIPPAGIERLIRSGHDVAGCVVPLRDVRWNRVRSHLDQAPDATAEELRAISASYAVNFDKGRTTVEGFIPVCHIGSAAMLITRTALQALADSGRVGRAERGLQASDSRDDGWAFFDPFIDDEGTYLSEDYAFCNRWRSIGGEVWADLRTPTRHIGPVAIDGDIAASIAASTKMLKPD